MTGGDEDFEEEQLETSGLGPWDGTTYTLEYFRSIPEEVVEKSGVQWSQTMGKVYINYPLVGSHAELSSDDVKLEISMIGMKVEAGGSTLEALTGHFCGSVRAGCTWWNIQEGETEEDGKRLYIILQKYGHVAWKTLLKPPVTHFFDRKFFGWRWEGPPPEELADRKARVIKAESPLDHLDIPDEFPWQALCIGLDDFEDYEDFACLNVRFDPALLTTLLESVTIEELFQADVTENAVVVYFRVYEFESPFVVFRGDLEGKCIPQFTSWEFVEALKCLHPEIQGYTPALKIVFLKAQDAKGKWTRVFASAKHASEFHAPSSTSFSLSGKDETPSQMWSGPLLNKPAVCKKFREYLAEGVPAKDATSKAISYVKTAASRGERWAIEE